MGNRLNSLKQMVLLEFHRIEMEATGVCSKHLHEYKWNGFYVESGIMSMSCMAKRL